VWRRIEASLTFVDGQCWFEVARDRFRERAGREVVPTLTVVQAAEARVRLNRVHAAIVSAGNDEVTIAPGHAIAASSGAGPDVGEIAAQLGGENAAPQIELEGPAGWWNLGSSRSSAIVGTHARVALRVRPFAPRDRGPRWGYREYPAAARALMGLMRRLVLLAMCALTLCVPHAAGADILDSETWDNHVEQIQEFNTTPDYAYSSITIENAIDTTRGTPLQ
jgi:hypothetical protein